MGSDTAAAVYISIMATCTYHNPHDGCQQLINSVVLWACLCRYEGTFVSGLREGQGTLKYADGSVYHGQWFQDKRHGQGILITATGDRYIGTYSDVVRLQE